MKRSRTIAIATIIGSLVTTTAFAYPNITFTAAARPGQLETVRTNTTNCNAKNKTRNQTKQKGQTNPVKALELRKERVEQQLKEGKITKEKADEIITKIDAKIKEIQEFNNMTLQQKRDSLMHRFKTSIEQKVKEGKLSQDKANQLIKDYTDKVNNWDGNDYPYFLRKGLRDKTQN
jgi:hypothetical protein